MLPMAQHLLLIIGRFLLSVPAGAETVRTAAITAPEKSRLSYS